MENVTDRTSNPFGMDPDCDRPVFGYGDANADFHVIGDHPGRHGGVETGIPFTDSADGRRLQSVLAEVGVIDEGIESTRSIENWFFSYLHLCLPEGEEPTATEYAGLERFFDAELRAIAAHVLLPVGSRAIDHVMRTYTARSPDEVERLEEVHAQEIHGSGFLVVPIASPSAWDDTDREALVDCLDDLLDRDYRQTTDLGRFLATDDPYLVR